MTAPTGRVGAFESQEDLRARFDATEPATNIVSAVTGVAGAAVRSVPVIGDFVSGAADLASGIVDLVGNFVIAAAGAGLVVLGVRRTFGG